MNTIKLIFWVINVIWCSCSVAYSPNECECHHEDAVQFVQTYYADLQSKYPARIGIALDYWYPHRLPDHEKFIEYVKQIQWIVAETELAGCWKDRSSIMKVNATVQLKNQLEPYNIAGNLYLKCTSDGWKIFLARQTP